MNDPDRVLVATDLSAPADEAIRQAHERAQRRGGELRVCHVLPNPTRTIPVYPHLNPIFFHDLTAFRAQAVEAVTARVVKLTGRSPNEFGVDVVDGAAHAAIVERAEAWKADLLVIGPHGGSALFGSVAASVVRYAHCPVLVARPRPGLGRVIAATDFSDAARPAVAAAGEEARASGARLTVVHAVDTSNPAVTGAVATLGAPYLAIPPEVHKQLRDIAETMLADALKRLGLEGETCVLDGSPEWAIEQAVREWSPELLVIGTLGRTGLRRVFLGSVAEALVQRANCPVLVVRLAGAPGSSGAEPPAR